MTLLVVYMALALGVSSLCSVLEAVLLSVTPSYVATLEQHGSKSGRRLARLKAQPDRPLAAILSLNTISHTVGAAGVGAQAQVIWGRSSIAVVSAAMTVLVLFVSEIVPKSFGASAWRQLAAPAALVASFLEKALYPLVVVSVAFSRLVGGGETAPRLSRDELTAMARLGLAEGVVNPAEAKLMGTLLRARDLRGTDILTPRPVVVSLERSVTVEQAMHMREVLRFSRIPVWEGEPENIQGYVLKHDLLLAAARDALEDNIGTYMRPIPVLPESLPMFKLLEVLVSRREQMAMLVDEYGGFAGVVTTEDVVEALLGLQISDEADPSLSMRDLARRSWARRSSEREESSDEDAASTRRRRKPS